jgi:hypothetical protein
MLELGYFAKGIPLEDSHRPSEPTKIKKLNYKLSFFVGTVGFEPTTT